MEEILSEPLIVKSHDVKLDAEYAEWIAEVKHRYRSAQVKAAVKVNAEKLLWNWQMGRDLVQKKAEERWGAGVVEQVSLDLQKEFPESSNFSARNLWYMKQWYLFYTENMEKLKQLVSEMLPSEEYEKNATQKEISLLGMRVTQAVKSLVSILGLPSDEYFEEELSPISERYDYAFRISHIQRIIDKMK